jgi:hypothetical protein
LGSFQLFHILFFGRFQMIFACANWSGPEIKTYFGISKNNGFCKFFLGAFNVINNYA